MPETIYALVRDGRWSDVAARANCRFGTSVTGEQIEKTALTNGMASLWACSTWSEGTWFMWIKNRLSEITPFPARCATSPEIHFGCELNVGFTQIEETPLMIARLRNESVNETSQLARTKLKPGNPQFVAPVNRVANLVAPEK